MRFKKLSTLSLAIDFPIQNQRNNCVIGKVNEGVFNGFVGHLAALSSLLQTFHLVLSAHKRANPAGNAKGFRGTNVGVGVSRKSVVLLLLCTKHCHFVGNAKEPTVCSSVVIVMATQNRHSVFFRLVFVNLQTKHFCNCQLRVCSN